MPKPGLAMAYPPGVIGQFVSPAVSRSRRSPANSHGGRIYAPNKMALGASGLQTAGECGRPRCHSGAKWQCCLSLSVPDLRTRKACVSPHARKPFAQVGQQQPPPTPGLSPALIRKFLIGASLAMAWARQPDSLRKRGDRHSSRCARHRPAQSHLAGQST